MPTYQQTNEVLDKYREDVLKGWLCPADGSLILVFSGGAVGLRVFEDGELTSSEIGERELVECINGERTEGRALTETLSHLERMKPPAG